MPKLWIKVGSYSNNKTSEKTLVVIVVAIDALQVVKLSRHKIGKRLALSLNSQTYQLR